MYFDTHAHYDDKRFDADRFELLSGMPDRGVSLILNPGCDRESSEAAIEYSKRYSFMYAAVGWHPHEAKNFDDESERSILGWAKEDKVKAIGEIGLDFHYDFSPRDEQHSAFIRQLDLARRLKMPVIIHDREAHAECMQVIKRYPDVTGVFHCYSGSAEMAVELVRMGWYLSFTGVITYKNAKKSIEVLKAIPLERIMIETDAPYLAPEPDRGKRNDSSHVGNMARVVADVKGISLESAAQATLENGKRLFSIQ